MSKIGQQRIRYLGKAAVDEFEIAERARRCAARTLLLHPLPGAKAESLKAAQPFVSCRVAGWTQDRMP